MRTTARLTNPKVMAVVKAAPKSAAGELNRLIAHKASTKIPITIRVQPIPIRSAEKNDSAGNCGFFFMVLDILAASIPIRQSKTTRVPIFAGLVNSLRDHMRDLALVVPR